jgi:hypothetical protein
MGNGSLRLSKQMWPTRIKRVEIYIIRIDGTDLRLLTKNSNCDYQPRWKTDVGETAECNKDM